MIYTKTERRFDSIFVKTIDEYVNTYWCQYIAILWTLLSISGITIAYVLLFLNLPFIIRLIVVLGVGVTLLPLIFVGLISAAVNQKTYITYKLLNRYIARHIPQNMAYRRKVLNRWLLAEIRKDLSGWMVWENSTARKGYELN